MALLPTLPLGARRSRARRSMSNREAMYAILYEDILQMSSVCTWCYQWEYRLASPCPPHPCSKCCKLCLIVEMLVRCDWMIYVFDSMGNDLKISKVSSKPSWHSESSWGSSPPLPSVSFTVFCKDNWLELVANCCSDNHIHHLADHVHQPCSVYLYQMKPKANSKLHCFRYLP